MKMIKETLTWNGERKGKDFDEGPEGETEEIAQKHPLQVTPGFTQHRIIMQK